MRVRVKGPHQVNVDGEIHAAGAEVDVEDEEQAARWIAAGFVERVEKKARTAKNK